MARQVAYGDGVQVSVQGEDGHGAADGLGDGADARGEAARMVGAEEGGIVLADNNHIIGSCRRDAVAGEKKKQELMD